jgi:hypothetical protein
MISSEQVQAILTQYAKHGWNLRRVLLSAESKAKLPDSLFGQAEIVSAKLDALWFSRTSFERGETWELRHLSNVPVALVEVFQTNDEEEVREETRREMETRLKELASKFGDKKSAG